MGDSKEREVNTQPSVNFTDNFFNALPVDARFNKVELREFVTISLGKTGGTTVLSNIQNTDTA